MLGWAYTVSSGMLNRAISYLLSFKCFCVFTEMPCNIPPPTQVYVRCSDANVICASEVMQHGEPHDIVFKVCHHVGFDSIGF